MDNLASIFSDEGQPVAEPVAVEAETPISDEAPAVEPTGEQEATPAEPQKETNDSAKGLQAALLAERRKRQELETQLREWQQQQAPKQAEQKGPPDPAAYEGDPQTYWRELARYEARQTLEEAVREAQKAQQQAAENERIAAVQTRLDTIVATGKAKFADFDAVINGGLAPFLTDELRTEIAASDAAHEVAYWLGKNPAEAQRLSGLDPRALAREVVKLEAKVVAPPKPVLPQTLTQIRDTRGQFATTGLYDGPTPLDAVLGRKT